MSAYSDCKKIIHLIENGCGASAPEVIDRLKQLLAGSDYQDEFLKACQLDWNNNQNDRWMFLTQLKRLADNLKGKRFKPEKAG